MLDVHRSGDVPGTEDQSSGGFDGPYRIEIEVEALRTQEGCPPWQGEGNETPFGRGEKRQQARSGKAAGASGRQEAQSDSQKRRTQEGRTQSRRQESRRQEKSTGKGQKGSAAPRSDGDASRVPVACSGPRAHGTAACRAAAQRCGAAADDAASPRAAAADAGTGTHGPAPGTAARVPFARTLPRPISRSAGAEAAGDVALDAACRAQAAGNGFQRIGFVGDLRGNRPRSRTASSGVGVPCYSAARANLAPGQAVGRARSYCGG